MDKANFAQPGQQTQRAAIFTAWGEKYRIANDIAVNDDLSANNVLINVRSTSVNPIDWKVRNGDMKAFLPGHFPRIPGRDVSGKITKVGSGVTRFQVGDEVYGMPENLIGSSCEFVSCSEESLSKKPSSLSWDEAAAFPLCLLTAQQAIVQISQLSAGQSILILGGSSGVGHLGVQIAKAIGATVYTTCGTNNVDWVKGLGADHVIDYKKDDFVQILGDTKVDVVFDAAGIKSDRDKSFDTVKANGRVVTTTPNDDSKDMSTLEVVKTVGDVVMKKISNYISNGVRYNPFFVSDKQGNTLDGLNNWINEGKLRVKIDSVFPLEDIQAASDKNESGKSSGKIVVEVTKD